MIGDNCVLCCNILSRSVFGSRREKNYLDERLASGKGLFYEENFSLPDSPEPIRRSRVGNGNPSATRFLKKARRRPGGGGKAKGRKRKHSSKKKQPQIFLTRLPLNELQDPEIFFTKIIKEDDSSVEIVPSDLRPDQLDALAHSPSLMFEEVPYHCNENLANSIKTIKCMARCECTRETMDLPLKKVKI